MPSHSFNCALRLILVKVEEHKEDYVLVKATCLLNYFFVACEHAQLVFSENNLHDNLNHAKKEAHIKYFLLVLAGCFVVASADLLANVGAA